MTGRAHHRETSGQVVPGHRLPEQAQRLVGTLAVQRGSGRLGGEPLAVPLARLGSLVPGVQCVAGVRADVRYRGELAPGRDGVLAHHLDQVDGHGAQQGRHRLGGVQDLPRVMLVQPVGRGLQPLLGVAGFRHLSDQLGGGDLRVGQAGHGLLQPARRPAAQRGDHRPASAAGHRPEAGQQRHHRAERAFARRPGAPRRREGHHVQVVGVTKFGGLFPHRTPQLGARRNFLLVQDPEQRECERQHPGDAVPPPGLGRSLGNGTQSGEPRIEHRGIAGRPAVQRRPAGDHPVGDLQQARRDRRGPGRVQVRQASGGPDLRRHPHPDRSAGGRRVRLAQHLPGRHRPFPRPDPAGQRDRALEDRALARQAGRLAKIVW